MKGDNTVVRAVTLPVEHPVNHGWGALHEASRAAFRLSTDLANWAVHHLFRRDVPGVETPDAVKPGPKSEPAKCYLYGAAVKEFPDWAGRCAGVASSAQCVFRAVHKKYLRDRFAVQVRHESSLLTYRYPFPWPVHNQDWTLSFAKGPWPGEAPVAVLPLPGLGPVHLRLSRGAEFGRQLVMLRQFIDGTAKKGEAAILKDRKGRYLVKLVGHFPRRDRGQPTNVAFVHTDPAAFLVVEVNGHRTNVTNADHVRRWVAAHRSFLQRAGEDKKREKRMDRRQRSILNQYVEDRCGKQRARLDTFVKQVAAQVRGICERRGVGLVAYDDSNRGYMREAGADVPFPWHALKSRLRQLLEGELGCGWLDGEFASIPEPEGRMEWLAAARATATAGTRAVAHANRKGPHPAVTAPVPRTPSKPSPPRTSRPGSARRSTCTRSARSSPGSAATG